MALMDASTHKQGTTIGSCLLLRSCRALMPRQYPQKKGWNVSSAKLESQDTPFSSHGIAARGERPLPQCQTGRSPWDLLRWHGDLAAGRSQNRLARRGSLSCPLPQHLPMPLLLLLPACACACACQLNEIFSKKKYPSQQGQVDCWGVPWPSETREAKAWLHSLTVM